jgi:hypothetical protein
MNLRLNRRQKVGGIASNDSDFIRSQFIVHQKANMPFGRTKHHRPGAIPALGKSSKRAPARLPVNPALTRATTAGSNPGIKI